MNALNNGYSNVLSVPDTAAMLEFAGTQPYVKDGPIGIIGYCMGGRLAMSAIGAFPTRIKAMASLYGGKLVTEQSDSPHLRAAEITGELYFGIADHCAIHRLYTGLSERVGQKVRLVDMRAINF